MAFDEQSNQLGLKEHTTIQSLATFGIPNIPALSTHQSFVHSPGRSKTQRLTHGISSGDAIIDTSIASVEIKRELWALH